MPCQKHQAAAATTTTYKPQPVISNPLYFVVDASEPCLAAQHVEVVGICIIGQQWLSWEQRDINQQRINYIEPQDYSHIATASMKPIFAWDNNDWVENIEIFNQQKMNSTRQNQTHPVQPPVQAIAVQGAMPKTPIPHCRCRVQATTCNKKVQESAKMKYNNNKWEIKPLQHKNKLTLFKHHSLPAPSWLLYYWKWY